MTILMKAACAGHLEVVRALLEWDTDKDQQDKASKCSCMNYLVCSLVFANLICW